MYLPLRMVVFYCFISLPEGIMFDRVKWHNLHIDYDRLLGTVPSTLKIMCICMMQENQRSPVEEGW